MDPTTALERENMAETSQEASGAERGSSGWSSLGQTFAPGAMNAKSEQAYETGMRMGAQTVNALTEARSRVNAAQNNETAASLLEKHPEMAGGNQDAANFGAAKLRAGDKVTDVAQSLLDFQKLGFQRDLSNPQADPNQRLGAAFAMHPESAVPTNIGDYGSTKNPLLADASKPNLGSNFITVSPQQQAIGDSQIIKNRMEANKAAADTQPQSDHDKLVSAAMVHDGIIPMPTGTALRAVGGPQFISMVNSFDDVKSPNYNQSAKIRTSQDQTGAAPPTAFSGHTFKTSQDILTSFANGSANARTVDAINRTGYHAETLESMIPSLGNTSSPASNMVKNYIKKYITGAPEVTTVGEAGSILVAEMMKQLAQSNIGTREDRSHLEGQLTGALTSNSPEQMTEGLATLRKLSRGQSDAMVRHYNRSGQNFFSDQLIDPVVARDLGYTEAQIKGEGGPNYHPAGAAPPAGAGAAPPGATPPAGATPPVTPSTGQSAADMAYAAAQAEFNRRKKARAQ